MISESGEELRVSRSSHSRARSVRSVFLVLFVGGVLTLGGCFPAPEEMREAVYQLEIFAAAAREFEDRHSTWPTQRDQLTEVLREWPAYEEFRMDVSNFAPMEDGRLSFSFVSLSEDEDVERGGALSAMPRLRLSGVMEIQPSAAEGVPAARLPWEHRSLGVGSNGSVTMNECALHGYEAPPVDN